MDYGKDKFLSEEDLDLKNMTDEEINIYWKIWFEQAQLTNEEDKFLISHGVFRKEPSN